ncbi:pyridoxal kinase PdxY [Vibrio cholerae]
MKGIISIQPHVVYGHAGNSSAAFPVQRMGLEIWPIHTVQYSNQTHYQQGWTGNSYPASDIRELIGGLDSIDQLAHCQAIISGYQGSVEQCIAVKEAVELVKSKSPGALYVCEPSMGGSSKSLMASEAVCDQLIDDLMPMADVIVPNQAELAQFTGCRITTLEEAINACKQALEMGPKIVLVKHLTLLSEGVYSMLLATPKAIYLGQRPLLEFDTTPGGIGDLVTALFTACLVKEMSPVAAFRHTQNAVYGVLELTKDNHSLELEMIEAQYEFVEPTHDLPVKRVESVSLCSSINPLMV